MWLFNYTESLFFCSFEAKLGRIAIFEVIRSNTMNKFMKNEIVIYQPNEATKVEVTIEDETVWLNKEQLSSLFGRDRSVISRHISNIFREGELHKDMVWAYFAQTTQHGAISGKSQKTTVEHYNLDVIISVGYRVKSKH